jgi:hypothetical protein
MNYSYLTTRKDFYNRNTFQNIPTEMIAPLSVMLWTFNIGNETLMDDDEEEFEHIDGYFSVVQGIINSIEQCHMNGVTPNYFQIIHFEHVFWFGFYKVTLYNSYDDEEIKDLAKNVEFIYENRFVDSFSDIQTNKFICNYLGIEELELDEMTFSFFIRLIEGDMETDGYRIRREDGYFILDEDDESKFILPMGTTEDDKTRSLYNILKNLVERIENEE